jgi:hypothetical protein
MRNIFLSAATALLAGTTLVGSVHSAELPKGAAHNIVLVHGAFVDQTSWQPVADILKKKGHQTGAGEAGWQDHPRRPFLGWRGHHTSR